MEILTTALEYPNHARLKSKIVPPCSAQTRWIVLHRVRCGGWSPTHSGGLDAPERNTLSCRFVLTFISIFAVLREFLLIRLQSQKVPVECWPHCHVQYCFISSFASTVLRERDYVMFGSLLSQIRLSSVTLVNPTHLVEPFGNISLPFCTLAFVWPPCKILRRSSQGNPSVGGGGVKRNRGSKIERWWTYRRLHLIPRPMSRLGFSSPVELLVYSV